MSARHPPLPSRRRSRSAAVAAAVLAVGGLALSACDRGEGPSAERFCGEVAEHQDAITDPTLVYAEDIEPVLDLYRQIAVLAPIDVEQEWNQLLSAYETASTVVPGDEESEQAALAAIYSSEKSAATIDRWLREHCAVDIGPVVTIVPHPGE